MRRNVTGGKVMKSLLFNQQNLVVDSEFYRKPVDRSKLVVVISLAAAFSTNCGAA